MAKAFAVVLVLSLSGLAALFADRQNAQGRVGANGPGGPDAAARVPPPAVPADASAVARGRQAFVELGCLRCHRVAGEGSPRSVLDHVGDRLFPDEIRAWIVADPSVYADLPSSAARAKSEYLALPDETVADLVTYLSSLRGGV